MNIDLEATKRTYDAIVSNYEDLAKGRSGSGNNGGD